MDLRMGLWRIGGVGADIGQRLGINWLTYNVGVFHYYHTIASKMAPAYAKAVRALWPEVRTAIDVGCGTGDYVAALSAVGISTTGYEYSATARMFARHVNGLKTRPLDLSHDALQFPAVDLAYSIEVAEHVPAALGDRLVTCLSTAADLVIFTAAVPGQGGTGHINEQPPEYWVERYKRAGMTMDEPATNAIRSMLVQAEFMRPWLYQNMMVFRRLGTQ